MTSRPPQDPPPPDANPGAAERRRLLKRLLHERLNEQTRERTRERGRDGSAAARGGHHPGFEAHRRFLAERTARVREAQSEGHYLYERPIESHLKGGHRVVVDGRERIMLASYSYLGLIGHPEVDAAAREALDRFGTGTHGVRLLAGTTVLHRELETALARFKGADDAVVFSSGFLANTVTISALVGPGDVVIGDRFNHASIVDGCRLSGAEFLQFAHNDVEDLVRRLEQAGSARTLVVTDAVFSMDGDIAPLPEISEACRDHGALLMVDEAHSLGVLGATGRGIQEHFGLPPEAVDIQMGTLSKTIPSVGGYVAGSAQLISALRHNATGYVFSAALPAPQAAAARAALAVMEREPERVARLQASAERYRRGLHRLGFDTLHSETAVVPVMCRTEAIALAMARHCLELDVFVMPVVYPSVPLDLPRLRTVISAAHTDGDIDRILEVLEEAGRRSGLPLAAAPSGAGAIPGA